jgi:hypothetical protein
MYLRRADHSSRGVLSSVECLECGRGDSIIRRPWPTGGCCPLGKEKKEVAGGPKKVFDEHIHNLY